MQQARIIFTGDGTQYTLEYDRYDEPTKYHLWSYSSGNTTVNLAISFIYDRTVIQYAKGLLKFVANVSYGTWSIPNQWGGAGSIGGRALLGIYPPKASSPFPFNTAENCINIFNYRWIVSS